MGYCDDGANSSVMKLSRHASVTVDGRTDDARYRTLLPSAPSAALRPIGGAAQEAYCAAGSSTRPCGPSPSPP